MSDSSKQDKTDNPVSKLESTDTTWGEKRDDNYGYASEEERLAKRGFEDWELVENIPESQMSVPPWFIAVIVVVLLVAIGLSFPFWGDRPGYERSWFDWGFVAAIVYISVASTFVYFMVRMYGSKMGGRLDSDKQNTDKNDNASSEKSSS